MVTRIKARDLKLADVIRLGKGAYMDATVCRIANGQVYLTRPYMRADDFSYTGGVILMTGHENLSVYADSDTEYDVIERKDLK